MRKQQDAKRWSTAASTTTSTTEDQLMALADATSGTIGSLVALLAFYPIDVIKTKTLCATDQVDQEETRQKQRREIKPMLSWLWCDSITSNYILYRGLHFKAAHTILSSFTYFYVYSMLASAASSRNSSTANPNTSPTKSSNIRHLKPATELLLSMVAAMVNVVLTLPFDVVSTRAQHKEQQHKEKSSSPDSKLSATESSSDNCTTAANSNANNATRRNDAWKNYKRNISSLWSGIVPSLILCINPAINYTLYDVLKRNYIALLWRLRQQQQSLKTKRKEMDRLNIMEAFLFGALAKLFATIITYPLIRAKVLMMVSASSRKSVDHQRQKYSSPSTLNNSTTTTRSPMGVWKVLKYMYRFDGRILGLYRGLTLQLLHTSLKSALLLMVRERITSFVRQLFSGEPIN